MYEGLGEEVLFSSSILIRKNSWQCNGIIVLLQFIEMDHILFIFYNMEDFLIVKSNDMQ